jgi:hypothetical protein
VGFAEYRVPVTMSRLWSFCSLESKEGMGRDSLDHFGDEFGLRSVEGSAGTHVVREVCIHDDDKVPRAKVDAMHVCRSAVSQVQAM